MVSRSELSRRGLLVLGAGLLAGCSGSSAGTRPGTASPRPSEPSSPATTTPQPSGTTSPAPSVSATLPNVRSWTAGAGEIHPEVKRLAVRATQDLLNRSGTRSVIEVIDAQYGGLLADSASVLVVCRQYTLTGSRITAGGTTVDVRLIRSGPRWRVTATLPAEPGRPASSLSTPARRVLADDRISLPPASVADVGSGTVHDTVLTAMLELATTYRIGVSVIRSGHPLYVFGTNRLSDHPRGRAFDTWQIDGHAVVDPSTPRSLVTSYMRAAASAGSYNVGGPYRLTGSTYFTDRTHHDHIHAGFRL